MNKLNICKSNPFSLAELRLIKEKQEGIIPCYTIDDIIEYAKDIRDWLEKHSREMKKLTVSEKKKIKAKRNKYYYDLRRIRLLKQRKITGYK